MIKIKNFAYTAIALTFFNPTFASEEKEDQTIDSFLLDKERGWYWYESLPEEEKEKVRQDIIKNSPTVVKQQLTTEEKPLSTAWLRENFPKYRDAAIDNPFDDNAMRTYLYLEKFMRDRSMVFGYQRQKTIYSDPYLDATTKRPVANFGMKEMNKQATLQKDALLKDIGSKAGLYFFYLSECEFCHKQAPLIKALEKEYGFQVRAVAVDGKPLVGSENLWSDYLTDNGQAQSLGVQQVPALYFFNPENQAIEMVSQGLQSLPDLQVRIIYAAERAKMITTAQAELIKPSGLYLDIYGNISNGIPFDKNAPAEFKELYDQSLQQ